MAKKETSSDLLGLVLDDLDELLKMTKNAEKEAAASNVPASAIGKALNSNGGINNIAASLNTIGSINVLTKVKKKDVEYVADIMKTLASAIKGFQISEDDAKGFDLLMNNFTKITKTFTDLTDHTFKNFFKFNPIKGRIIGSRLGQFYKAMMNGFESTKLKDFLKTFKESQNMGNNLGGFSQLIATMFAIDWKQLLKIGYALKLFPEDAGKNLAGFFNPIIACINMLPEDHKKSLVEIIKDGKKSSSSFEADARIKSFMDIFNLFASLPLKSILVLSKLGTTLNADAGKNIKGFFTPIFEVINGIPSTKTFAKQINHFYKLFNAFSKISIASAITLSIIASHLDAKTGKKIGGFFAELVKKINEPGEKQAKNAVNMVKSFSFMITALTLSFVALVAITALAKPTDIILSAGLLIGLVQLSIYTIKKLSDKKIAGNSKDAIITAGIISVLFFVLTGVFATVVAIVKNNKLTDILLGSALLVGIVGLSLLVLKKLSDNKIKNSSKDALLSAGTMILIMLAMTTISAIAIGIGKEAANSALGLLCVAGTVLIGEWMIKKFAKLGKDKSKLLSAILAAGTITLSLIALSAGLIIFAEFAKVLQGVGIKGAGIAIGVAGIAVIGVMELLKKLSKTSKAKMMIGVAGLAAITLGCLGIAEAMNIFADYMLKVKQLTLKDVTKASGIALGVIAAVIAIEVAAAACISGPQAVVFAIGLAAAATISAGILAIGGSLSVFCDFLLKTKQLSTKDIEVAANKISGNAKGNMMGCLKEIIISLSKFGPWAAIKVAAIGVSLFPVFEGLSKFVDVIQKMANMQIVDHYEKDKNGNQVPIYRKMKNSEFLNAATTLSTAFTLFMNKLYQEFNSKEKLNQIKRILKTFKKGNVGQLMEAIGSFAKAIVDFASLQVADKWDKKGNPIHFSKLKSKDFKDAATTLASAFSTFIITLHANMSEHEDDVKELLNMFSDKSGNSVTNLIDTVCHCIDPLVKLASGTWGDNSKTKVSRQVLLNAVDTLVDPIIRFINKISNNEKDIFKATLHTYSLENIVDSMVDIANQFAKINGKKFADNAVNFNKGSIQLFATLERVKDTYTKKSKTYKYVLEDIADGLDTLYPIAKKSWKPIENNTKSLSKFDRQLIGNRNARNQAITEITSNFKTMNDEMIKFNDSFRQALDMFEKYLDLKKSEESNWFTMLRNGTSEMFNKVGETVTSSVQKIDETIHPTKDTSAGEAKDNNTALVSAITGALTAWSNTAKNVTLELNDSGVKAIGKVYLK